MNKMEAVGKVLIDYTFYSGEDLYSDGKIEDELLDIVRQYKEEDFGRIINEKNDWVYLYHLSQVRKNIVSWIPMKSDAKVLEIGSGCGAITGALAEKGEKVDCVELSKKRSLINANLNKNLPGITIKVGNFEEIEPYLDRDYDVITLIGVWEYSAMYLSGENPFFHFLELLKKHMKKDGMIIVAIENKFGMKYWAGCKEDHSSLYFEGLEGYTRTNTAVTFGHKELEKIFREMSYQAKFYYPYPDYKLPLHIYSDEYLPQKGVLNDNGKNLDNDRVILFDERKVFDSVIQDEMFPYFSNSFLIILRNEQVFDENKVIYTKYSNERRPEFRIRTDIIQDSEGNRVVKKYPMHKKAQTHIQNILRAKALLDERAKNLPVMFNKCKLDGDVVTLEYVKGNNLEDVLEKLLLEGKENEAKAYMIKAKEIVLSMVNATFRETEEFVSVFGSYAKEGEPAVEGADIDLIFSNIICQENDWNILDYEWTFRFPIPAKYILYRMILYFQAPQGYDKSKLYALFEISEDEQAMFYKMDQSFMEYVYCGEVRIADSKIIKPKYRMDEWILEKTPEEYGVSIYFDYGLGMNERDKKIVTYTSPEDISIDIGVDSSLQAIRLDPMEHSGIVYMKKVEAFSDAGVYVPNFQINGYEVGDGYYSFETEDPWFYFQDWENNTTRLHIELEIGKLSPRISHRMLEKIKEIMREAEQAVEKAEQTVEKVKMKAEQAVKEAEKKEEKAKEEALEAKRNESVIKKKLRHLFHKIKYKE
ncbi:MAG: class I SAM-dependent methyltransferase [Eubacteriales bacterium]|nr:class I SAM-dependent methyltransferase [Eubacteriales bacterium]